MAFLFDHEGGIKNEEKEKESRNKLWAQSIEAFRRYQINSAKES